MLPISSNPLMFEKFEKEGIYAQYDLWLHKLEQKYDNFTAPPPRWFTWPDMMGDPLHLTMDGVNRHMEMVVELIDKSNSK